MRWRSGIGRSDSASGRTIPKSASVSTRASISRETNFRRLLCSACTAIMLLILSRRIPVFHQYIPTHFRRHSTAHRPYDSVPQPARASAKLTTLEVNWRHREYESLGALATLAARPMAEDLPHPSHVDADRWQGPHDALPALESLVARRPICQLPWADDGTNTLSAGRLRDSVRLSEA